MKKIGSWLLIALLLLTALPGCAAELPPVIDRIAVSGPLAQIVLFALAPDKLVGLANAWDDRAAAYFPEAYRTLPLMGQLYGGKGTLNLETLLAADPQVVIDVGEAKSGVDADMAALTEQTGIPFVHVTATLDTLDAAFIQLGALLHMEAEAAPLAAYCAETYARALSIAGGTQKARLLYITGAEGLNVIAQGSYHAEVIDLLGDNLAVVDAPSSKGTGNETDMEQILSWNPDVLLISPDGAYDLIATDPIWQGVQAVADGRFYEVPDAPYNWMGFPPSGQRLLGMLWMAKLLYPDEADYDLYEEAATFYRLFYHTALSRDQYDALVKHSIGRLGA